MRSRVAATVLVLHVLYAALWIVMDGQQQRAFERWAVAGAELTAFIFYMVLIVAFYEAQKTRLNFALAIQKFYWWLLIGVLALPTAIGLIYYDAPYRSNPYALFSVPGWLRSYIWIGLAVSLIGVLWEFYQTNWGDEESETWPAVDRRSNPYGRRLTDHPDYKDMQQ